eukprot:Clim_evm39s203 gene=Clim_evmTU39s203
MAVQLRQVLSQNDLDHYAPQFEGAGITLQNITNLTMQDYGTFGVTQMQDRKRLFQLIQTLKTDGVQGLTQDKASPGEKPRSKSAMSGRPLKELNEDNNISRRSSTGRMNKSGRNSAPTLPVDSDYDDSPKMKKRSSGATSGGGFNYGVPTGPINDASAGVTKSVKKQSKGPNIRVCVRKRPLSRKEASKGDTDMLDIIDRKTLSVNEPKVTVDMRKYLQEHNFHFDEVFEDDTPNEEVYRRTAKPLIESVFEGTKCTCFAYGQTGSGKTHTMMGNQKAKAVGIYVLAARDMFELARSGHYGDVDFNVGFYEIYCGALYDLLGDRKKVHARENHKGQVVIQGMKEKKVTNVKQLMDLIDYGTSARSTGSTGMNSDSSRSHAILQIDVRRPGSKKSMGRFTFIDLAGSERAVDVTDTDKQTRLEGAEINQSLLALKECIRALDQLSRHTPFRQSKLTQVLKDSLRGKSKTVMIANVAPGASCTEHTLNTLRYADRVKELKGDDARKQMEDEEALLEEEGGEEDAQTEEGDDDYYSGEDDFESDDSLEDNNNSRPQTPHQQRRMPAAVAGRVASPGLDEFTPPQTYQRIAEHDDISAQVRPLSAATRRKAEISAPTQPSPQKSLVTPVKALAADAAGNGGGAKMTPSPIAHEVAMEAMKIAQAIPGRESASGEWQEDAIEDLIMSHRQALSEQAELSRQESAGLYELQRDDSEYTFEEYIIRSKEALQKKKQILQHWEANIDMFYEAIRAQQQQR